MMTKTEKENFEKCMEYVTNKISNTYESEDIKYLSQAYYNLAKAELLREIDPKQINKELLELLK